MPLAHDHHDQLVEAVHDGELWKAWYTTVPSPPEMRAEIGRRLALEAQGSMLPFAVISSATGKAVGMTTFMAVDAGPQAARDWIDLVRQERSAIGFEH